MDSVKWCLVIKCQGFLFGNLINKSAGTSTSLSVWAKIGYSGSKLCHLVRLLLVSSPVNNSINGSSPALVLLTLRCKHIEKLAWSVFCLSVLSVQVLLISPDFILSLYVCESLSHLQLFVTPWTVACQASLSWNSLGKSTGVDCHSLLQRNFPTQGSNPGLLHHRQILYHLKYREVYTVFRNI